MGATEQRLDELSLTEHGLFFGKAQQVEILEHAKQVIQRLRKYGFRVSLDRGLLLIGDETGRRRDVTRFTNIATVFDTICGGLDEDPGLLDS
jgi:hypothetical protein